MKKAIAFLCLILIAASTAACAAPNSQSAEIAATTLPVYDFTVRLCEGTDLKVIRLVTESVSCLHDYSLNVKQVKAAEGAQVIIKSGAGLEDFMKDLLDGKNVIDASEGIDFLPMGHNHENEHSHSHEHDPHIWLSPENGKHMAQNICAQLINLYPQHKDALEQNLTALLAEFDKLQAYGEEALAGLSCRELITFHDGFSYFAKAFDLKILRSVEEESGSEASAAELQELIDLVKSHRLPAIFTEVNGSTAGAKVIASETGVSVRALNMAMSGDSYFEAMYQNIDTIKEALAS